MEVVAVTAETQATQDATSTEYVPQLKPRQERANPSSRLPLSLMQMPTSPTITNNDHGRTYRIGITRRVMRIATAHIPCPPPLTIITDSTHRMPLIRQPRLPAVHNLPRPTMAPSTLRRTQVAPVTTCLGRDKGPILHTVAMTTICQPQPRGVLTAILFRNSRRASSFRIQTQLAVR